MIRILLSFIFILIAFTLIAQVDDITPPGNWKKISITAMNSGFSYVITAEDDSDITSFYILSPGLSSEEMGRKQIPHQIEVDSSFVSLSYLGKSSGQMEDDFYFLAIDTMNQSHFITVGSQTASVSDIPSQGNWRRVTTFTQMSDNSLYGMLSNFDESSLYPVLIERDTVRRLTDNNITFFISHTLGINSRNYEDYTDDVITEDRLAYYDIDYGFVVTDIPAATFDIISDNPGDSVHAIVTHNSSGLDRLFRVEDSTFNEVVIPGGPYNDISVLWRSDMLQTTLFSLEDTAGNVRLAKREQNDWTNLTSELLAGDLISIKRKAEYSSDAFFEVNTIQFGQLLYNYQAYDTGDTLFNVTPDDGPYTSISFQPESITFPMSILMNGPDGEYLYSYYYGLRPFLVPPHSMDNPGGIPYVDIFKRKDNIYSFDVYNIDSSLTSDYLYIRVSPGNTFTPLSTKDSISSFDVCKLKDEVIFKEFYPYGRSGAIVHYDMTDVAVIDLPNSVSDNKFNLLSADSICIVEETLSSTTDSVIRRYATNDESAPLIDVTDPRYGRYDFNSLVNYLGDKLSVVQSHDGTQQRLFLISSDSRAPESCNRDYKYYYEESIPAIAEELRAKQHFIGGALPFVLGEEGIQRFVGSEFIRFEPGMELQTGQGVTFEIDPNQCEDN